MKDLIKQATVNNDVGTQAKLKLNSMLVDLVEVKTNTNKDTGSSFIREYASKTENLIPEDDDFDSKFK